LKAKSDVTTTPYQAKIDGIIYAWGLTYCKEKKRNSTNSIDMEEKS